MHLLAFILLSAAPAPVDHAALACIPAERYARIAARDPQAAGAELQFRTSPSGPWYSTRMTSAEGEWSAFLPRPARTDQELQKAKELAELFNLEHQLRYEDELLRRALGEE